MVRLLLCLVLCAASAFPVVIYYSSGGTLVNGYAGLTELTDTYRSVGAFGDNPTSGDMAIWSGGYSGHPAIYSTNGNFVGEVRLEATTGNVVTLQDFRLGGYLNSNRTTTVHVYDLNWNDVITPLTSVTVDGTTGLTVNVNQSSAVNGGFIIQFYEAYNVGLNFIDVGDPGGALVPSGIPEPQTFALIASGMSMLFLLRRHRR